MEISAFTAIEAEEKRPLRVLREAFRENRVVSSLAGDFDQKALWEALTSHRFERHVAPADRALLREHLLWTRLVRETETEGPSGNIVDLVPWAIAHRTSLVLKPNLLCGGEGVTLGPLLSAKAWERVVLRAVGRASLDPVVNVSRGGGLVALYRSASRGPGRSAIPTQPP